MRFTAAAAVVCLCALAGVAQILSPDEVRISSRPYQLQPQILRVESRLIRIDAVVRDNQGRIVSGLKPGDFAIFDDGKKQAIATFDMQTRQARLPVGQTVASPPLATAEPNSHPPPQRPRYVALYFDDLHTLSGDMRHVQLAAENFLRQGLTPNDQIALFTASSSETVDFTPDASEVLDALGRLKSHARVFDSGVCPRITPNDAYLIVNHLDSEAYDTALAAAKQCNCDDQANINQTCYTQQEQLVRIQAQQMWEPIKELSENTLGGIQEIVNHLESEPGDRVLVLASSGFLTGTLERQVDAIVDDALRSGILINALDAKSLYTESPAHGQMQNAVAASSAAGAAVFRRENENFAPELMSLTSAMVDFSLGTGGRFFHNRNDLTTGYYSLAAAPQTEYLLGFVPERAKQNGAFHKLKVEVTAPGKFDVQARPGYFAPTAESSAESPEESTGESIPDEKLAAEVRGSERRDEFPLNVSENSATTATGSKELNVQARVDIQKLPFQQQNGRYVELLTVVTVLFDAQGNMVVGKEAQMNLALKPETFARFSKSGINGRMALEAPAGSYRLRVVVQEAVRGQMSATTQDVQVH